MIVQQGRNNMYKYEELSQRAQNKALKDYLDGWLETHPNDPLDADESHYTLLQDLTDYRYSKSGELLSTGE